MTRSARDEAPPEEAGICQHTDHESESGRLFYCAWCGTARVVCRDCDRGWSYCPWSLCAFFGRLESLRRAARVYRSKEPAKKLQRKRQNRYRLRQALKNAVQSLKNLLQASKNVTHQSPPRQATSGKVEKCRITASTVPQDPNPGSPIERSDDGMPICCVCRRVLKTDFLRLSFVRRR